MTLQSLLDLVITTLRTDLRCESIVDVETQVFSDEQFLVKVRAQVREGRFLQVRIYHNRGHSDYSYQLFADRPLTRWDNKEDCPGLENYPHHRHLPNGAIEPSQLQGDPILDLPIVAQEVAGIVEPTPRQVQLNRRMRK
jgi:hypothetical protein